MQNPTDYQIDDKGRLNSDGLYQKVKKNEEQAIQCLLDMGAAFDAEFLSYEQRQYLHRIHLSYMSKVIIWRRFWRDGKVQTTDGKLVPNHEELKQQAINAVAAYLLRCENQYSTYAERSRRHSADKITAALISFGMIPEDDYSPDERLLLNDNVFSIVSDKEVDADIQNAKLVKHMRSVVQYILSQRNRYG